MTTAYSLTEQLAQHLRRRVDAATRRRARLHLLDWIGCVAGAMQSADGRRFRNATALGSMLEMDDVHRAARLHPGPIVWPAATAEPGTIGTALDAGVRGYEAMIAIGVTFDAHHYAFYHPTATAGVFGAAAACGSAMGLPLPLLVDALGNAGSMTGGLWRMRHEAVQTKAFHLMQTLNTGLQAARWAPDGLTGPRFILEGEQGLYAATCRSPLPMRLQTGWRIAEVSFKPWAACRHAHPAIDAALKLREVVDLRDGEIVVATYADALTFCDRANPVTVIDAKFSLQHAVAVVVCRGAPAFADFEADAIAAADLIAVRARVRVVEDPAITARYPSHFGACVSAGGHVVERIDTLGDPERPLDRAGVIAKAHALFAWGGSDWTLARRAINLCLDADDDTPIEMVQALIDEVVGR